MKGTLTVLVVLGLLTACNFRDRRTEALHAKIDSLRAELEANQNAAEALQNIWSLMDSMDVGHSRLRSQMKEGAAVDDYMERMRDISNFAAEAERRITLLETKIASVKTALSAYAGTIKKLKRDLDSRHEELASLEGQMEEYRNQNTNLVQTVGMQQAELAGNVNQIDTKQHEITVLEVKVKELLASMDLAEADACFDRARALEELANRTRFAPRKKRETRKEALELYRMAASYGKIEAKVKITELEKQI